MQLLSLHSKALTSIIVRVDLIILDLTKSDIRKGEVLDPVASTITKAASI
jgi:hypothetical protein